MLLKIAETWDRIQERFVGANRGTPSNDTNESSQTPAVGTESLLYGQPQCERLPMRPRCRMSFERARTRVSQSKLSCSTLNSAIDESMLVARHGLE